MSVIDTRRGDRLAATIDVSLARGRLKGATPDALTVSPDGKRLYVALAGENAVAVVDVARRRTIGFIPTAWHPVDVDVTPNGRRLVVTATNGADVRANRCAGPYAVGDCTSGDLIYGTTAATTTATMTKGVVNLIRVPRSDRSLARLSARVRRNNRVEARRARKPSYLRAIKHVIYVIKENRTYDQILGDIKGGRGDRTLTLFKDASAPNHRALARRFTLFDNFYADADVSADGHSWSVSAGVSDYTSRTWPITYSPSRRKATRARDFEHVSLTEQYMTEPLLFDPTVFRSAAALTHGYLWDNAYYHGVSFRNYGEFTKFPGDCVGDTNTSETTTLDDRRFGDHVDERYAGFNMRCFDHAHRIPEWEREFRGYEAQAAADPSRDPLPQLQFVRLPNDHTLGTRPGEPTPEAFMADNDLALGRLVDVVSHSRFWASTAILVTEDDAQNGPDHIDAHRTRVLRHQPVHAAPAHRPHALRHGVHGRHDRGPARAAADDDRRPARDPHVEGLQPQAQPHAVHRPPAEGRSRRRAGGRAQRALGAARPGLVELELRRRGRDAGDPAQRGDLALDQGPAVAHAGAEARLHHRLAAGGRARVRWLLAVAAVLVVAAAATVLLLRERDSRASYDGNPAFALDYDPDLLRTVAPRAGELLRLRGDGADGLRVDIAVRPLRLPAYRGDASGILPISADRHLRGLRAATPRLVLRQEGKANIGDAPGYEVWFRPRPGDRGRLGRDTLLVPRSGARDGLVVSYRQAKPTPLTETDQDVVRDMREAVQTLRFGG